jgi:hypothetical protein
MIHLEVPITRHLSGGPNLSLYCLARDTYCAQSGIPRIASLEFLAPLSFCCLSPDVMDLGNVSISLVNDVSLGLSFMKSSKKRSPRSGHWLEWTRGANRTGFYLLRVRHSERES